MSLEENKILIISPTYNEKENIRNFIVPITNLNLDLLVIDDNSPDGTGEIIKEFQKSNKNIYLIQREKKMGLGSAYRDGFNWAIDKEYDYIIEMDFDLSHRIEDLIKIIDQLDGYDLVVGSRYINGGKIIGWDKKRLYLSKIANLLSRVLLGHKVNDSTSGFRAFKKESINKTEYFNTKSEGYFFQIEIIYNSYKNGLKIKEVPITFINRIDGLSKIDLYIIYEAARNLIILFFNTLKR